VGDHKFLFEKATVGGKEGTLLIQREDFSGLLSFMMGDSMVAGWMGQKEKTKAGFENFNQLFKTWVERADKS